MPLRREQFISAYALEIQQVHGAGAAEFVALRIAHFAALGDEEKTLMWQSIAGAVKSYTQRGSAGGHHHVGLAPL